MIQDILFKDLILGKKNSHNIQLKEKARHV